MKVAERKPQATYQRDAGLDLLKGAGCVLMILAHSGLKEGIYDWFFFLGGLAPVMFFSASGVTASFQAAKYRPRGVLLSYLFLLLLGYSFNSITDPGFLGEIELDMIQMIAVGSAVIYLLEYFVQPAAWVYLPLGLLAFAAKFLIQGLLNGFAISGVTNLIVPPGIFPIFPWLFLFLFGLLAYRIKYRYNLVLAAGFGLALLALSASGYPFEIRSKWDMKIAYFLGCCAVLFGSFFLLRAIPYFQKPRGLGWLTFLGRNSLLFLYVHFPLVLYLKGLRIHRTVPLIRDNLYLFWVLILVTTTIIMLALMFAARWELMASAFNRLPVWILMTMLVFAVGLIIPQPQLVYDIEIGLGVLTALFYQRLAGSLKHSAPQLPA